MQKYLMPVLGFALIIGLQNCSTTRYVSQPAGPDFLVDGQATEWTGRFQIPKHADFAVGLSYDKNYLYLALSGRNREISQQLARGGLKIWLDPKGKKHTQLAVVFKGRQPQGRGKAGRYNRSRQPADVSGRLLKGPLELIVLEDGRERLGPADLLAVAESGSAGLFLEYQIPRTLLGSFDPAHDRLGLGFESAVERPSGMPGRGGGMSGGQMGMAGGNPMGGHQGAGGRGVNRMSSGGRDMPDDLDIWLKVQFSDN